MLTGKKKKQIRDLSFICVMLAIPILHWLVFWLGVNANSILMAFKIPTGEWSMESLNSVFREFRAADSQLLIAVKNTLLYFVKDIIMLFFQLFIAYFLYKRIRFYRFYQIIFYLPAILSGVAIANLFSSAVARSGPIGLIFTEFFNVKNYPALLWNSDTATWTILFYTVWTGWGGSMLLLGGALARIPVDLLESAKLDGIKLWQELVYLILPLVWSTVSTLLILTMTTLFTASGPILLFTKGEYKTTTIGYWIFDKVAYQGPGAYNQVAAAGLLFTLAGVPIILFVKWLIEKIPVVEY